MELKAGGEVVYDGVGERLCAEVAEKEGGKGSCEEVERFIYAVGGGRWTAGGTPQSGEREQGSQSDSIVLPVSLGVHLLR